MCGKFLPQSAEYRHNWRQYAQRSNMIDRLSLESMLKMRISAANIIEWCVVGEITK